MLTPQMELLHLDLQVAGRWLSTARILFIQGLSIGPRVSGGITTRGKEGEAVTEPGDAVDVGAPTVLVSVWIAFLFPHQRHTILFGLLCGHLQREHT